MGGYRWQHVRVLGTMQEYYNAITGGDARPVLIFFTSSWDHQGDLPWYRGKFGPKYDKDAAGARALLCCIDIDCPGTREACRIHDVSNANMPAVVYIIDQKEAGRMEGAHKYADSFSGSGSAQVRPVEERIVEPC